jgi:hypothetical protein
MYYKDPSAVLDYAFDWDTNWLGVSESISSHTVTLELVKGTAGTDLTKDSDTESSGVVTAWLSSGTAGQHWAVGCYIETDAGRKDERTVIIKIRQR